MENKIKMKEAVFEEKLSIIYDAQKRTFLTCYLPQIKSYELLSSEDLKWNVQNIVGKFNDANDNDCNKFEMRIKKKLRFSHSS